MSETPAGRVRALSTAEPERPSELGRGVLAAEHEYIAQTAFQANEDRARASQYFLVTFATLIAALLSVQLDGLNQSQLYWTFVVIFALLVVLGLITLLELVRLRTAWLESVRAMNQIKARALEQDPALAGYFRWDNSNIPPAFKARSLGFLQAVSVSLLSGLALGAAVAFGALAAGAAGVPWLWSVVAGLVCAGGLLWLGYVAPLRRAEP